MTVLILGGLDDLHACHMLEHLRLRGVDVEVLDSRWFPSDLQVAYDPVTDKGTLTLPAGRTLALEHVQSVYWRCYNQVQPPNLSDHEQVYIAGNDARSLFESLLQRLPARWVNGWGAYQLHQTKPVQLAMVAARGIHVPATLLGNDPQAVRDFVERHPRCIFKPVQGGAYAKRVTPAHLTDENLRNLASAPVTIQEEVPGTNVRVFIAGDHVLACEVRTEAIDYRDGPDAALLPHELPAETAHSSLAVARTLGLVWTGIDYRLTPDGEYFFLEANPSPMFLGFELQTGLPLTESLASLLIGGR
jgi:glutathione synthase/RimK-type ligase-like ATP-grasp enzyme